MLVPRYKGTLGSYIIENGLACNEDGGYFRHLYDLYETGELTSAINRIIEDMNHRFVLRVLTDARIGAGCKESAEGK